MFATVQKIEMSLAEALSGYSPSDIDRAELKDLLEAFSHLERLASAAVAATSFELICNHSLLEPGDRSDAHSLARMEKISLSRAREIIDTGKSLAKHPVLTGHALSGEFSASQLSLVSDAIDVNPSMERNLIEKAAGSSLGELKEHCTKAKALATDPDERRRAIHRRRYLRTYTDTDGMRHLRAGANPEELAFLEAAIEDRRRHIFEDARRNGTRESYEAYGFDAMIQMFVDVYGGAGGASTPAPAPAGGLAVPAAGSPTPTPAPASTPTPASRAKIIVRIDHAALIRGHAITGEVSEIAGIGPIAPSAVIDMIESGDPFLAAVVTKGEEVTSVVHLGRRPNAKQQTALQWLYPTCAVKGCQSTAYLEMDHRKPWANTRITVLSLLDRLCSYHHGLKTRENWSLVAGHGKRAFVPPEDPRHPARQRQRQKEKEKEKEKRTRTGGLSEVLVREASASRRC